MQSTNLAVLSELQQNIDLGALVKRVALGEKLSLGELPNDLVIPDLIRGGFRSVLDATLNNSISLEEARKKVTGGIHSDNYLYQETMDFIAELEKKGKLVRLENSLFVLVDELGSLTATVPISGYPLSTVTFELSKDTRPGLLVHSHSTIKPPSFNDVFDLLHSIRLDNPDILATIDEEDFWIMIKTKESEIPKLVSKEEFEKEKWFLKDLKDDQVEKLTNYAEKNKLALYSGSSDDFSAVERII